MGAQAYMRIIIPHACTLPPSAPTSFPFTETFTYFKPEYRCFSWTTLSVDEFGFETSDGFQSDILRKHLTSL